MNINYLKIISSISIVVGTGFMYNAHYCSDKEIATKRQLTGISCLNLGTKILLVLFIVENINNNVNQLSKAINDSGNIIIM